MKQKSASREDEAKNTYEQMNSRSREGVNEAIGSLRDEASHYINEKDGQSYFRRCQDYTCSQCMKDLDEFVNRGDRVRE